MADRAALHKLVDELPEQALDATFRVLENYQKYPPKNRADVAKMLRESGERFRKHQQEHAQRMGRGMARGSTGGGSLGPDGSGRSSVRGWEGQTSLTVSVNYFRGHELHTEERMNLSDDRRRLVFSVDAKLPNGAPQRHEFTFDVAEPGT